MAQVEPVGATADQVSGHRLVYQSAECHPRLHPERSLVPGRQSLKSESRLCSSQERRAPQSRLMSNQPCLSANIVSRGGSGGDDPAALLSALLDMLFALSPRVLASSSTATSSDRPATAASGLAAAPLSPHGWLHPAEYQQERSNSHGRWMWCTACGVQTSYKTLSGRRLDWTKGRDSRSASESTRSLRSWSALDWTRATASESCRG